VQSLIDGNTGAVLITHLHGESAGSHEFLDICRPRGIPLIEDTAQSFGAMERGRRLGTIGRLGIYSFGFYKNLNAWRGGMLVSQDEDLIVRIRRRMEGFPQVPAGHLLVSIMTGMLTDLATYPPVFANLIYPTVRYAFLHDVVGVNRRLDPENRASCLSKIPSEYLWRMAPAQALLALKQLDHVDRDNNVRRSKAAQYHDALARQEMMVTPEWNESSIYVYYPVQYRGREALLKYAMQCKRDFAAQHLRNCADLPEFREFYRDCPNARAAARNLILLPTYPRYPDSEIQKNIDVIRKFCNAEER
jgi:dTDP-4-amino-4,6-dideoxygalactose transaminase